MAWFVAGVVAVILIFGYFGLPIVWWTLAAALLTWYLGVIAGFGVATNIALAVVFVVIAAILNLPGLRRKIVSDHVLAIYRRILPDMSQTEKEAIDAGTVWWDADLFSGKPDWNRLLAAPAPRLGAEEQAFLDGPVEELCALCSDWEITHERLDLPPQVWQFIKDKGFLGMIIPKKYGGLGFSALAHSAVVMKLATRSSTAAISVMVPNSLGPGELLLHYGTDEQKNHYLPRLAKGLEVPCFALTEPYAGSDAASMRSSGVVCRGAWQGKEVLGMRLSWDKRYITLASAATVLGLAFKLRDPEHLLGAEDELGITCALIPTDTPGVEVGERHDPMGVPFLNGPTRGRDVFVPLEFIIGGPKMAGRGWVMLMQCLAAGRGISLPALSAGASQLATRVVGAHATIREQFGLPIGRFEGIEAKLGRIAGLTYTVDAARRLTLGAIDAGEKPAVITAIMKAYTTEAMRVVVNDAVDVLGGNAVCRGPRNTLAHAYQSVPIGITVEGHNILTRSMIIFGQGAIRCHPFVQSELAAADANDVPKFDAAFWGHVGLVFANGSRAIALGLSDGAFARAPVTGPAAAYFQRLSRYSAAFAFTADVAMGTLGAALKRKENLSGRLADVLAWLYLGSSVLKRYVDEGQPDSHAPAFRWAMNNAIHEIETALKGLLDNLPLRWVAWGLRPILFPLGARARPPSDRLTSALARAILDDGGLRIALTQAIFLPPAEEPGLGFIDATLRKVVASREGRDKIKEAQKQGLLPRGPARQVLQQAQDSGVITPREAELIRDAESARDAAVQVDSFPPASVAATAPAPAPATPVAATRVAATPAPTLPATPPPTEPSPPSSDPVSYPTWS